MNRAASQDPTAPGQSGDQVRRRLLNIQEVSDYIGLSVHTVYTMVSQRRIPYVKVGRLVKFDHLLIDVWIKQKTVMPLRSIER